MNILLVYANPDTESLSFKLREAFERGARGALHHLEMIDLYEEKFNPVLSREEERGKGELTPEVVRYQLLIAKADVLVFVFPVWWFRAPAILEGWFDRVFTRGFAYRYKPITKTFGIPVGLLPCKKAIVINTYGSPWWAIRLLFADLPWRRLKHGILKFCGIKKLIRFSCYSAPYATDIKKEEWLKTVEQLGQTLK